MLSACVLPCLISFKRSLYLVLENIIKLKSPGHYELISLTSAKKKNCSVLIYRYWLYAAVTCKCLLVTNDEMRDHLFQLLGTSFFPRWKEKHQVLSLIACAYTSFIII